MRVLIIKTSSMGDVIHTLPALTDAGKALPDISFDWVVEENFAEIPSWHPRVKSTIPIAFRRWRKSFFSKKTRQEWAVFCEQIKAEKYDLIIDGQGLLKSVFLAWQVPGKRCGFDFQSARDPLVALFYHQRIKTAKVKEQHAVMRLRDLFSQALGYSLPDSVPDYGIDRRRFLTGDSQKKYLVFLHGTTWETKHWPEVYWIDLAKWASDQGFLIQLPWGNSEEHARAMRIAEASKNAQVLPRLDLSGMAKILAGAEAVVAVDTGLCHLAAALAVPTVSLYGPTHPDLTGALGVSQTHLTVNFPCAPCFSRTCLYREKENYSIQPPCFTTLPPSYVLQALPHLIKRDEG